MSCSFALLSFRIDLRPSTNASDIAATVGRYVLLRRHSREGTIGRASSDSGDARDRAAMAGWQSGGASRGRPPALPGTGGEAAEATEAGGSGKALGQALQSASLAALSGGASAEALS